jgi:hypothetical protein
MSERVRVWLDLVTLKCIRPVTGQTDLCYAMISGVSGEGGTIIRVHPEEKAWKQHSYSWPMGTGESRAIGLCLTSIELSLLQGSTIRVIFAARKRGSYFSSLLIASQMASTMQQYSGFAGAFALGYASPVEMGEDLLIGEFTLMITNWGNGISRQVGFCPSSRPNGTFARGPNCFSIAFESNGGTYSVVAAVRLPAGLSIVPDPTMSALF